VSGAPDRRRLVEDFVDLMYRRKDVGRAFDTYVSTDYVQHNPGLADGRDAAREPLVAMFADPGFAPEVVRLLVDGDLCAVHLRIVRDGRPVAAVLDLYRWDGEQVVEHWDVIQPWPATSANDHPMF
jgi:predicted SnoaL-like aldol condensation-catalyzing enzyme